jgi:DNA-binding transcriptional regulator YdaS (Cro superfamily)
MFADHIIRSGKSRAAWAAELGISKSYLSHLANGDRQPSLEIAAKIERLTNGAIPAASWIPDHRNPTHTPQEDAA